MTRSAQVLLCSVALAGVLLPLTAGSNKSARDGVFTEAQAARGRSTYHEECAKCHNEALAGGEASPELAGSDFSARWDGKNAGDLIAFMKAAMPPDDPGHLHVQQYSDLAAFILSVNGFPSGKAELSREMSELNMILIEWNKQKESPRSSKPEGK